MNDSISRTAFRAFLYGAGCVLLAISVYYLLEAAAMRGSVPILFVMVSALTSVGLLLVVYAEHQAREEDKKEYRRISRVAHQLEMPLTALKNDMEDLFAQAASLPPDIRLKLKYMDTKTKTLLSNIRDVFIMLQAQEGTLSTEKRIYDACALVSEVVVAQRPFAKARNTTIVEQSHCEDAPIRVDRRLFVTALTHVIHNAVVYTVTPGLVNVYITKSSDTVRIIIQDRGIGVQKKDRTVMWQPFARGTDASRYFPEGLGVGLTVSRQIIREFGGNLTYVPRSKRAGSEFIIQVPLAQVKKG